MTLQAIAGDLCDLIAPALALLIAEEPLLLTSGYLPIDFRRGNGVASRPVWWKETLFFWLRSAACIAIPVMIAETSKANQWWAGHPGFPSGHSTFTMSAGLCLFFQRGPRWLIISLPAALLMGESLVYLHWHTREDVLAGWTLGAILPTLLWRLTRPLAKKMRGL